MSKNSENGTVIIEATMIFPLVILVVFLLMTLGNAYYQRSRVNAIVETKTIEGAAYCADELLRMTAEKKQLPTNVTEASVPDIAPYKYIFTGETKNVVEGTKNEIREAINKLGTGYFNGMKVHVDNDITLDYSSMFIAQSVKANIAYHINLPVSIFGMRFQLNCSSHIEVPLSDSPEFIRNIDMVLDYFERTALSEKIEEVIANVMNKVKEFLG